MIGKKLKTAAAYVVILAAGLGAGLAIAKLPAMFKKPYVEGNYAAYFPDTATKVVVYGTETCPFCIKTRAYLKEHNIAFADLYVDQSEKAKKEFAQLGGGGVPMILIGNRRIEGFNQAAVEDALKKFAN
ncbi:glutaredoxin family protein [Massilia sp. BJB1822]|uniref:glutaredoxin family protein n=1 Tax=Massilia sp. BJB1822 TaxID=2744470 RepID=UPI001593E233|nr:glutaredoxin family protein [Massilia sp. BJB1822]NVE01016.1 glutaredoxin family protein [Massilia sp. BJB1822]